MRVNEIFYSLQGEGAFTGYPAIFIRFAGCNQKCDFCDTIHEPYKEYTEDEIVREIASYGDCKTVILTGGEPTLQLTRSFIDKLHDAGKEVHIETNGSVDVPGKTLAEIDWITVSPKAAPLKIANANELKVVYWGQDVSKWEQSLWHTKALRYLQPLDTKNSTRNAEILQLTIDYIKSHPVWKLSLQTQKILNVR